MKLNRALIATLIVLISNSPCTAAQKASGVPPAASESLAAALRAQPDGACAVVLRDGSILTAGGLRGALRSATARVLKPDGSGPAATEMMYPRAGHACVTLADGRVLAAGGTTTGGEALNSAELFDPASATWSPAGAMSSARSGMSAALLPGGRVLLAGGESNGAATAALEVFDPETNRFETLAATLSSPRTRHAAAALEDGRVLIAGGSNGETVLDSVEVFDPEAGTASRLAHGLGFPRQALTATLLLDGRVYMAGGSDGKQELASAEIFDPLTGLFTPAAPLLAARSGHTAVRVPNNNSILIAGGNAAAPAELYVPWQDRSRLPDTPDPGPLPTLYTDRQDFLPGDAVSITGAGWAPDAKLQLVLSRDPKRLDDTVLTVEVKPDGTLAASYIARAGDASARFTLTATSESGRTAQIRTGGSGSPVLAVALAPRRQDARRGCTAANPSGGSYGAGETLCATGAALVAPSAGKTAPGTFHYRVYTPSGSLWSASGDVQVRNGDTTAYTTSLDGAPSGNWTLKACRNEGCTATGGQISEVTFVVDTTPPVIAPIVSGTLGSSGWYTSNVSVDWSVTDPESAVTSVSCDKGTVTTDSVRTFNCTATSAGGTSTQSVTIRRDATPPSIVFAGRTAPNASGWNNTAVTLTWNCADTPLPGLTSSGVAAPAVTLTLSSDGAGQTSTGTCSDLAGNTSQNTQSGINIDMTPPAVTLTSPPDGAVYTVGTVVSASYSCSDGMSGLVTCGSLLQTGGFIDTGSAGAKTYSVTATDLAGNLRTVTNRYTVVGAIPVAVTVTVSPASIQYSDRVLLRATVTPASYSGGLLSGRIDFTTQAGPLRIGVALADAAAGVTAPVGFIAGNYAVRATFIPLNTSYAGGYAETPLTVQKETAVLTLINDPAIVQVTTPGGTAPSFPLSLTVSDPDDGSRGNISYVSQVWCTLTSAGGGSYAPIIVATGTGGIGGSQSATCMVPAGLPPGSYGVAYSIVSGYYTGGEDSVILVVDTSQGYTTGAGTVTNPVTGNRGHFTFNVKQKNSKQAQGQFLYVERRADGGEYRVRADDIASQSSSGPNASFSGKGTCEDAATGVVYKNCQFVVSVTDNAANGANDTFRLAVTMPPNVSVTMPLTYPAPAPLLSGNIHVP